ncbi:hypothetical protein CKN99_05945 [Carnobacterium maltaromaticum]|uniref:hypothetical protein n=1 Tax=Carnobacterium maltaromaticum TaxID=2751 RepID=UPI0010721DAE|nr:hypothetical protein [Carnobacterium maltaromaticum]MDT1946049.1 hypothetical protein [Carnobacterium maltaromaticum]MDT2000553.1 hypothetical protein [Carnobacterium maltaromaticum]TFJ28852.1 hypothetical protein CKN90_05900 [Carnobacterium maltaromaticum]TFJ32550.1 hypothetical protein CKN98_05910 [Carnobacterium maltaromaticum]TFJ36578.1 hypothetical protein CKN88_05970 [Carnobacterium maltaromaticum]
MKKVIKLITKNKKLLLYLTLFLIIVLIFTAVTFNKGTVTTDKWNSIEIGMSTSEVEEILGKPLSTSTDNSLISENIYSDYQIMSDLNDLVPNEDLTTRMQQLDSVYDVSESGGHVKELKYKVTSKDGKREAQIYFLGGIVKYINRVNE